MKKGLIIEGTIEKVEFPNKGIVKVEGERLIVKNTIPGQKVQAVVTKGRKGKSEGRMLELLEKSPMETKENVCPHFNRCGGCIYQSLPYEEQMKIKEQQVKELLDQAYPDGGYEWQGLKGSPISEGYRNKMEFSFGDEYKDGPLALGMHKRGSMYDIVNVDHCQIVHPDFCQILTATRTFFAERNIPYQKKMSHEGYLRHLLVRRAVKTGEILVDLVTTTQRKWLEEGAGKEREDQLLTAWRDQLLALPLEGRYAGILHTENDSLADVVQNDHTDILYGQDFFFEELLGMRFKITPFSFFQTNSLGAELLYETARSYVGDPEGEVIFDLYSGTGTIAQVFAPVAKKVIGVEIIPEAVEAAKENAAANGLTNCTFWAGDVLKVVDELEDRPDLIVLDPPRDGIHPKALPKICEKFQAKTLIYISCKPTSLARDLVPLREHGYYMVKACAVDMFPGTANCETVCLLSNRKADSHRKRSLDMEDDYRIAEGTEL